ncbi:MAG: hypothetical protein LQ337_002436 [Flavoplaca oasis]|nr:MAG: hypothetical protein LQ337_002436 [Flavoplaca oasis]
MTGNPPPTPPSTAPTSPTHLTEHGHGNCVINIGTNPEKDGYNEAYSDPSRSPTLADRDVSKETFNQRLKQCLPTSLLTAKLPHIPKPWRKEDGREKHIACIDDHPKGYPKLAAFMNSSDNFLMSRRFSFLHSRVLLHRQDELAQLEKALIAMDDEDQELDQLSLESRRRDDQRPEEPSRKSLMTKIDNKLRDYDDLIARIRRNVAIPRPLDRDYGSLYRWIDDLKPLCREESKFIKFLLSSPEERKKTDDEYVQLYSKYRVDVLARLILTVVAVVLLMVPTAVLFLVQEHGILKIMLIMIFTMLFSAALSVFTKAKRHEMFAATAA